MSRIEVSDVRVDNVRSIYDNPYRAGGAMRVTHLPTGLIVLEETHHSQIVNRDLAWAKLETLLCERELEQAQQERDAALERVRVLETSIKTFLDFRGLISGAEYHDVVCALSHAHRGFNEAQNA